MRRLGYPVIAPANPLRGLTSDADYIRSVLATITGPIVLVGHSYGGAVITNAARGVPNVKALVYVAAFVPDQGESILNSYDGTKYPGSLLGPTTTEVRPIQNPSAPQGQDLDIYIQAAHFREVFAGDQSASRALTMAATQRPLSLTANTEAVGCTSLEDPPELGPDHAEGQRDLSRWTGLHGTASARTHLQGALCPRRDRLSPSCCRAHHPGGRPVGALNAAMA